MFWRSSSSSSSRRTYGLEATDLAASPAFALLLLAPMGLLTSFSRVREQDIPARARPNLRGLRGLLLERDLERVADRLDVVELQVTALVLGDLLDVSLVAVGNDDLLDP